MGGGGANGGEGLAAGLARLIWKPHSSGEGPGRRYDDFRQITRIARRFVRASFAVRPR